MERTLLLAALGMGCAGWLGSFFLTWSRPDAASASNQDARENPGFSRASWVLALGLPILVWLATLPTQAPFSAGQGWGRGFLMGAVASLLSALVIFRATLRPSAREMRAGAAAAPFAALALAAIPLLWMRNAVIEVLVAQALGWIVVALILLISLRRNDEKTVFDDATALLLVNGAAFAGALCSVAALGVYRDFIQPDIAIGTHPALALMLAASVAFALFGGAVVARIARDERFSNLFAAFLSLVLPLGTGYFLATRLLDDLNLFYSIGAGLALGFLLWALVWDDVSRALNSNLKMESGKNGVSGWALLAALSGFMLSYGLMQGFGAGLMLLAAWPVSVLALPFGFSAEQKLSETTSNAPKRLASAQQLVLCLSFLAILLVSRFFATRFRLELRGADLSDQFALFGFLAGALVPSLLSNISLSSAQNALMRTFVSGVLTLVIPSAILSIWGAKVMPAFLAGLALGIAYSAFSNRLEAMSKALFALGVAFFVAQWTQKLAPLVELSRAERLHYLTYGAIGLVVVFVVLDLSARLLRGAQSSRKTEVSS